MGNYKNNNKYMKQRIRLNIGCWNVRTLLDNDKNNRPERRTALVTKELERLNIDIAALSETRFSDEDHLSEVSSGYTIFWIGKPTGMKREGGVGFAIKTSLVNQIEQPSGISDRIMKLRAPLAGGRYISLLSIYAPTLQASEENIASFYADLRDAVTSVPKEDKLIILGDFNARVGKQYETWNVIGPYGIGNMNNNGLHLLQFCSEFDLAISNTFFRQKEKHKATWFHPRSKHGHLIDYIIIRKNDLGDLCNVRVLRSAECDTDHKLVRGKLKLRIRKKVRMNGVKVPKRLAVSKLANVEKRTELSNMMNNINFEGTWMDFKTQVYNVGVEVLGFIERKHQDWFDDNDDNIKELLSIKHTLHQHLLSRPAEQRTEAEKALKDHKATLQREIRRMKNEWWSKISQEVQSAYDRHDSKMLYHLLRQAFGPRSSPVVPMKSLDGSTSIKDPEGILKRWSEHFSNLFFNPSDVDNDVIDSLPQSELFDEMAARPILDEVKKAIKEVNTGKAPGLDGIPVELLRFGGENVASAIWNLILLSWEDNPIPQDWIDGILVSLFKGKGLKSVCDDYRGITLLESAGKVLARLLLNRLMHFVCPTVIPEAQSGFRAGRGTMDMVFSVRQLQEKCIEQRVPLYQVFVDLTKAFDTVNRQALWKILGKVGCPPVFVNLVRELHRDMKARFTFNGVLSEEIAIDNGVKQGDILAPTLFSIYFSVLLSHAFKDCNTGVAIRFRTTGKVFNLRRFNTKSKNFQALIRDLLYADDADFVTHTEEDLQLLMDRFSSSCNAFGLQISIKKTKVMFTPSPGMPYTHPSIVVNGITLGVVDTFPYLGSMISRDGALDNEIFSRIQKASVAFGKLEKRVWSDRGINVKTKVDVYKTCVLTSLLYSSEAWTTYRRHIQWLERFHQKCLRRILNVKWQSLTPDTDVLHRSGSQSIEALIMLNQMRWSGHVVRMEDHRLPKQLFYGELVAGKRPQCKPRKRFKDCVKENLKAMQLDAENWEVNTMNRDTWRSSIQIGSRNAEAVHSQNAKLKRDTRKGIIRELPDDKPSWKCNVCERVLLSKAGYVNHLKSHAGSNNQSSYTNLPPRPDSTTCVICRKVFKSASGLKRHMHVHKKDIVQPDPINPIKTTEFICHICKAPMKSNAGLKSHLRAHGRESREAEATLNEEEEEETAII